MDKVFIRQPYNYDVKAASDAVAFESVNPTLAQQQFKDEADINRLVDRFLRTGEIPPVDGRAIYGNFLDIPLSYQDCLEAVCRAQEVFDELPSKLRQRFNNDPAELLSFLQDPKNLDEAVKLGLLEKPAPEPEPVVPAEPAQDTNPTKSGEPGTVDLT